MSKVGQKERVTQNRVARLLHEELSYGRLGNWEERPDNSNTEKELLLPWLASRGVESKLANKALFELEKLTSVGGTRLLYDANRDVYEALRYGIKVLPEPGAPY